MGARNLAIGQAAAASGLPVKTIRYYEEIGLIPAATRTNGGVHGSGHRTFSEDDVARLRFIHHARLYGLSLAEIRDLLALAEGNGCPSRQPAYRKILGRHLQEIDERVRHLLGLRAAIEGLMSPQRQANAQVCSWGTCECMRATEPPSSGAATSSSRHRNKGGTHV